MNDDIIIWKSYEWRSRSEAPQIICVSNDNEFGTDALGNQNGDADLFIAVVGDYEEFFLSQPDFS